MKKILVVDDEKNVRRSLTLVLSEAGYDVSVAEDAIHAMGKLSSTDFDLLILDVRIGEISGLQLFQKIRDEGHNIPVLFMSGNASLTEAVETIRLGGTDFLEKPFEPGRLLLSVTRALRIGELERTVRDLRLQSGEVMRARRNLIGESAAMKQVWAAIEKAAPTKAKVLIYGETGTGKELIARAIHELSSVAAGPFVKVNCAAIPAELIESELFGHERGSFTGASQLKRGLFEIANRGTIFLDEIGEMSPDAQAKVLRVLQNQEISRVGGSQTIRIDVRVVAATHRDLVLEVKEGRFREDLFFRLNVLPIFAAPLRERRSDIPLLFSKFLAESCQENGFASKEISLNVMDVLTQYYWPGNIRELRNLAERLAVFSGEKIELKDIPAEVIGSLKGSVKDDRRSSTMSLESFRKRTEREFIVTILKSTAGNVTEAARVLEIERTYLHRKISEHAILKKEYF